MLVRKDCVYDHYQLVILDRQDIARLENQQHFLADNSRKRILYNDRKFLRHNCDHNVQHGGNDYRSIVDSFLYPGKITDVFSSRINITVTEILKFNT